MAEKRHKILENRNCIQCENLQDGICIETGMKINVPILTGCVICEKEQQ